MLTYDDRLTFVNKLDHKLFEKKPSTPEEDVESKLKEEKKKKSESNTAEDGDEQ